MKVDFLIIGAARSATTSISQILGSHPDICFSRIKEPQFFCKENWRENITSYHSLFLEDAKIYGEGSTNYSKYPFFNKAIHSDIFEYNPNMKFIYIMRHPIDRILSHYQFAVERGYTTNEINKEILANPIYINTSKYYKQAKLYIDKFGRNKIKLVLFEDYKNDPKNTIELITQFLGIPSFSFTSKLLHTNKSQSGIIGHIKHDHPKTIFDYLKKGLHYIKRKIILPQKITQDQLSPETILRIKAELKEDINQMERLLNKDLSSWLPN